MLTDASLAGPLDVVRPRLSPGIGWWVHGADLQGWQRIDVAGLPDGAAGTERPPTPADRVLQIYTSGTTGLPKAVNITHARVLDAGRSGLRTGQPGRLWRCGWWSGAAESAKVRGRARIFSSAIEPAAHDSSNVRKRCADCRSSSSRSSS